MKRHHTALLRDGIWPDAILQAFRSTAPAIGLTHDFYRYPARFAPEFVRSVIAALISPADLIFDPFMGAGTTAVEALAAGRMFIGCDVNPLATFVAKVKTTPLDTADISAIREWNNALRPAVNLRALCDDDYYPTNIRNLPWTLRKTFGLALQTIPTLRIGKRQAFARCTLLRTGQWALDCRSNTPSVAEFFQRHRHVVEEMIEGTRQFQAATEQTFPTLGQLRNAKAILTISADAVGTRDVVSRSAPLRLILTSPPYLGVHILYHRWQVRGRRETPAPFWLAGCPDGHGASYYTFASRGRKEPVKYLDRLSDCLKAIANMRASSVTSDCLQEYVRKRLDEKAEPATINRELALLKRAFSLGMRSTPPKVRFMPHFPHLKEDNIRTGFVTDTQAEKIYAECAKVGLWMSALFWTLFEFGFRVSEALNLRVKQIDIANKSVDLNPGETKSGKGRTAIMTTRVYELIKACVIGKGPDDYVFTREKGKRITDFRAAWSKVTKAAGAPELLIHDLRRSAIRRMVRRGIPEKVAMLISGHRTRSVFDRYDIVSESDLRDAAAKLEAKPSLLQLSYNFPLAKSLVSLAD
jgi:integrase